MRRLRSTTVLFLGVFLAGCDAGYLYPVAGSFGLAFEREPDCATIETHGLGLASPFTMEAYFFAEERFEYEKYPLVAWPGAFVIFQNEDGLLLASSTEDTAPSASINTPEPLMDGDYHHLALTMDANGFGQLFVDGSVVANAYVDLVGNPGSFMYLGCWPNQDSTFAGIIGDVRLTSGVVYDSGFTPEWLELEPEWIDSEADITYEALSLWHLNEGEGSALLDEMGKADGTLDGCDWVPFELEGSKP